MKLHLLTLAFGLALVTGVGCNESDPPKKSKPEANGAEDDFRPSPDPVPRGDNPCLDPLASQSNPNCNPTNSNNTLEQLLFTPEKEQCDQQNLMYNREAKTCYNATLDLSWCTSPDSVVNAFQQHANAGAAVQQQLNGKYLGYTIDQCGFENNKPVVTLYKIDYQNNQILTGLVRAS